MSSDAKSDALVLGGRAVVPDHVVHREFTEQSVALNLQTGIYHALNPTAARMFDVLSEGSTVADAATRLASEFDQPSDAIERDLIDLCRALDERGLIELHGDAT